MQVRVEGLAEGSERSCEIVAFLIFQHPFLLRQKSKTLEIKLQAVPGHSRFGYV
jgi:hypothetical protein